MNHTKSWRKSELDLLGASRINRLVCCRVRVVEDNTFGLDTTNRIPDPGSRDYYLVEYSREGGICSRTGPCRFLQYCMPLLNGQVGVAVAGSIQ